MGGSKNTTPSRRRSGGRRVSGGGDSGVMESAGGMLSFVCFSMGGERRREVNMWNREHICTNLCQNAKPAVTSKVPRWGSQPYMRDNSESRN